MEEKTFKLDIYNNTVCNNLYNCQKGEKYCKTMVSKLIFYDRDELLKLHEKSLTDRDYVYDISTLEQIDFLSTNEKVDKVVPLEGSWIAVFFVNKKTKEPIKNKVMYISSEGDGYFSDNIECALNGKVPIEIYCKFIEENPNGIIYLDRIFKEDYFGDDRKKLFDISRGVFTRIFSDYLENPDIKLEDIPAIISAGFKNREDKETFEKIKVLDLLYSLTASDYIIEFNKKYNEFHSSNQPGDN